jgi:hypothetical protein
VIFQSLPRENAEHMIGDLLEEYEQDIIPRFGTAKARLWLYRHSASLLKASLPLRWLAILAAVARWFRNYR